jgi:hypothetical protein
MRRAFVAIALALLVLAPGAALASPVQVHYANRIDAIGLVDYRHSAHFKVGDYVRYRVVNHAPGVQFVDYTLTLLIAGEEEFWGEKCFWLETWSDENGGRTDAMGSLVSYDIFRDSLADERIQLYRRKMISGLDEDGNLVEELTRGNANLSATRTPPVRAAGFRADTLGVDSVLTPVGALQARHVKIYSGKEATETRGDSTIVTRNEEHRERWLSSEVPITHDAREITRSTTSRRAWKIGYSSDAAPAMERETGTLEARVIEFGHHMKPRMLPPDRATSFEQQAASHTARRPAGAKAGARTAARH